MAGDMQNGREALENSLAVSERIKHELAICPLVPLLGIYPIEMKTYAHRNIFMSWFQGLYFIIGKNGKQLQLVNREAEIDLCYEILPSNKKEQTPDICYRMDEFQINYMLSEVIMYPFI